MACPGAPGCHFKSEASNCLFETARVPRLSETEVGRQSRSREARVARARRGRTEAQEVKEMENEKRKHEEGGSTMTVMLEALAPGSSGMGVPNMCFGSPVSSKKVRVAMESPFSGLAGSVTFSGASPGTMEWLGRGRPSPSRGDRTPPPKSCDARMPLLLGEESPRQTPSRLVELSPLHEGKDEQMEQAALVMSRISRSPSGSPSRAETRRPKAERRPPTVSVYAFIEPKREEEEWIVVSEAPTPTTQAPVSRKRYKYAPPAKPCNCRRSRCLKLYCECFAAGVFCRHCNCSDCLNVVPSELNEEDVARRARQRQERDGPDGPLFEGRVRHCDGGGAPELTREPKSSSSKRKQHAKRANAGCFCKRSKCLKKYCECFEAGALCDATCRCESCLNWEGSPELAKARAKHSKQDSKFAVPIVVETPVSRRTAPKVVKKKVDGLERASREAWQDLQRRAVDRCADEAAAAEREVSRLDGERAAAEAVAAAADCEEGPFGGFARTAVEVALRIATAAATEGTRASFSLGRGEVDQGERVAKAVADAAFGAVAEARRDERLAEAAAAWGLAAAYAAQASRSSGAEESAVETAALSAARAEACKPSRRVAEIGRVARRLADQTDDAKTRLASIAKRLRKLRACLHNDAFGPLYDKHLQHLRNLSDRDGDLAPGLPIHRPLALKALQCLPSEDLYGSCLVSRDWSKLALDQALWSFYPHGQQQEQHQLELREADAAP